MATCVPSPPISDQVAQPRRPKSIYMFRACEEGLALHNAASQGPRYCMIQALGSALDDTLGGDTVVHVNFFAKMEGSNSAYAKLFHVAMKINRDCSSSVLECSIVEPQPFNIANIPSRGSPRYRPIYMSKNRCV